MLMLLASREDVLSDFEKEERRVFPWMTKASNMTDIAFNVLSFWLVEDSTHKQQKRRSVVLHEFFERQQAISKPYLKASTKNEAAEFVHLPHRKPSE